MPFASIRATISSGSSSRSSERVRTPRSTASGKTRLEMSRAGTSRRHVTAMFVAHGSEDLLVVKALQEPVALPAGKLPGAILDLAPEREEEHRRNPGSALGARCS